MLFNKSSHADFAGFVKTMQRNFALLLWRITLRHTELCSYVPLMSRLSRHKNGSTFKFCSFVLPSKNKIPIKKRATPCCGCSTYLLFFAVEPVDSYLLNSVRLKQSVTEGINVIVNNACDAEEDDACGAKSKCKARVIVRTERGNGRLVGLNVHSLYDEEVVVK